MPLRFTTVALVSVSLLLACGSKAPEPAPAAAPPAEPQIDRLTLLKIAQERLKAEREKKREEMRAVGAATVTKIKRHGKTKEDTKLEIEFELKNASDKELSLAEGTVEFRDLSDKLLKSLKVPFEGPIKPGAKAQKHGKFPIDPAEEGDIALVKTKLQDLKIVWIPKHYRFADGTKLIGE
jgi:major membrane immunogen (membrane-anchored lipoprotein)